MLVGFEPVQRIDFLAADDQVLEPEVRDFCIFAAPQDVRFPQHAWGRHGDTANTSSSLGSGRSMTNGLAKIARV